ncbi:class I histocompatibility antigen, F10 alpha chain-like isoform X2 [Polypterus senegalus]|uniref:class I histocompatibility antigen, F10 alpha chain-like isoform X2 n=1 Tax=Polypterus senegalus TaxID=55291 RepID=UPI0019656BAC|nr:class I histocompatibility antigen, F10 alpha chain-like isoform X2 [Polypterus senegalus]
MKWTIWIFVATSLSAVSSDFPQNPDVKFTGVHSLHYTYSALSSNQNELPTFVAMGLIDDRQIDYYDSNTKQKVPRQAWMEKMMSEDYWKKGTLSRKSKEQWFRVNVDILMSRTNDTNGLHVLQWMHGCEVDFDKGSVKGMDMYSYDGKDFLSFDKENMQWVAPVEPALQTKIKWDKEQILNQYTKGYLENECVDWLKRFMNYSVGEATKSNVPTVRLFGKRMTDKVRVTCLATGFYPRDIKVYITKDGEIITPEEEDPLPNDDHTFQTRRNIDINPDDKSKYACKVLHNTLEEKIIVPWDRTILNENKGNGMVWGIMGACILLFFCSMAVLVYKYRLKRVPETSSATSNGNATLNAGNGLPGYPNGHVGISVTNLGECSSLLKPGNATLKAENGGSNNLLFTGLPGYPNGHVGISVTNLGECSSLLKSDEFSKCSLTGSADSGVDVKN